MTYDKIQLKQAMESLNGVIESYSETKVQLGRWQVGTSRLFIM